MRSSTLVRAAVCAAIVVASAGVPVTAQPAGGQASAEAQSLPVVPVRVDVLLTRFQGEKKISSLPFSLLANAAAANPDRVSMRMGIQVPIGTSTVTTSKTDPREGSNAGTQTTQGTTTNVRYRDVGTDIDSMVTRLDETRFSVRVGISDSSFYSPEGTSRSINAQDPAAFRSFQTSNTVVMRDGQTILFGTGSDKISGETLKIEVTLHVVK